MGEVAAGQRAMSERGGRPLAGAVKYARAVHGELSDK